ncbi:MAG: hypothetical protein KBT03_07685, partial [Bacteroidales bacterium]|nr:hypothetical protein [Candidatus Scybalousia scybalohippi]
ALSDMYDDNNELLRQVFEVADDYKDIANLYNESLDDLDLYKKAFEISYDGTQTKEYWLEKAKEELSNENI